MSVLTTGFGLGFNRRYTQLLNASSAALCIGCVMELSTRKFTMAVIREQTQNIQALLSELDVDRAALLDYYKSGHAQTDGRLYAMDMFVLGVVKRTLSSNHAMQLMVRSWNLVAARTLLRTHIDTGLRFSAAWLVDDPEDFAKKVFDGVQIDRIKHGKERMTDSYLISMLSDNYPWLKEVYDNLSGYIHFSNAHINSSLLNIGDDGKFDFRISEYDFDYPESSWLEVLDCFREITGLLIVRLAGYSIVKGMSPDEVKAAQAARNKTQT